MPAEKALALVVRGTDWSETSRIATVFTREFGKVRGLAKGGRRLRSGFEIAFDLLSLCHVVFLRKASAGLDLFTEAQLVERFPNLRVDLRALYAGYYVAELLADGTQDYDPHPILFDAAVDTLRSVTANPVAARVSRFELAWLKELGYSPRLDACAVCGAEEQLADSDGRVVYGPTAGGVLCPRCRLGARDRRPLSAAGFTGLRALVSDAPLADVTPEIRSLLGFVVSSVLTRRPKMLDYLDGAGR
ncbi:MAG TPA: DNA repair protein RecO [Fimbriiglobus sp.]